VRSVPVKKKVGKDRQTTGHNYYASFAGVLCLGPVQVLHNLWVDDQLAWEGPLAAGTDDSASITVEGRGVLTLYWGTETQEEDPALAGSGLAHPAYRGQCYVVFHDWLLGENRAQVPPIEFEVTRVPQGSGLSTNAELNGEAHPLAALEELLLNRRFGAGLGSDLLDYPAWNAAATALAAEGFSVSVLLGEPTKLDALLNDFLEYLDACLVQTADGKLGLRLLRAAAAPVTLGVGDLTEPPDLTAHGWPETVNEIVVRFANRNRNWQTDSVAARDPAAFAVTKRTISQAVECDWVSDQAVAWKIALGLARTRSLPWLDGSLRVRRGVAAEVRPGDTVQVTYAPHGIDGVLFRVLGVEVPGPDAADLVLRVREDTAHLLGDDYLLGADAATESERYEPQPCHDVLVFEPPYAWAMSDRPLLLVLPARGDTVSNRFTVWWERSADSFGVAAEGEVWGLRGTLNAALAADGMTYAEAALDVTFTSPDDQLDDMPFAEGAENERFLVIVGHEIMFGFDPVLTGTGRYTVSLLRGQKGTLRADHAVGTAVWVVQVGQQELTGWTAPKSWPEVTLKVQPHLLARELSLADAPEITHPITRRSLRPLGPTNLMAQGDGVNPTYSTGQDIVASWTLTSDFRSGADPTQDVDTRAETCLLELWVSGVLKGTLRVEERPPHTITNSTLVSILGSEVTFTIRAYLARGSFRSVDCDEITVSKV
jgi:hypothetical protein